MIDPRSPKIWMSGLKLATIMKTSGSPKIRARKMRSPVTVQVVLRRCDSMVAVELLLIAAAPCLE